MAKAPKKRVKKGTGSSILKKKLECILGYSYSRVKFIGTCEHEPRAMGVQRLFLDLRGEEHTTGMGLFLKHLNRTMNWVITVSCFFKNENEEIVDCVEVLGVYEETEAEFVGESLQDVLKECVNLAMGSDDRYNESNFGYYAYCLMPEYIPGSLLKSSTGLSDLFVNIVDMQNTIPLNGAIPFFETSKTTIRESIIRNGNYPKIKEVTYYQGEDTHVNDTLDFLEYVIRK